MPCKKFQKRALNALSGLTWEPTGRKKASYSDLPTDPQKQSQTHTTKAASPARSIVASFKAPGAALGRL